MKNQHQIAQILDRCAERANFIDREPATQKQCWYLAKLMLLLLFVLEPSRSTYC